MRYSRILAVATAGALALGLAACGSNSDDSSSASSGSTSSSSDAGSSSSAGLSGTLNGAGSTFQQPLDSQWATEFKNQGVTVNYQGTGSGAGIASFTAGTVDFAGTDAAMTDDEIAAARRLGDPVHIPIAMGAVTVSYNVDGVDRGLRLDGPTIADIFLGRITKWNDPEIARLNAGTDLPDTDVTICHRSDDSGTTANFTLFLSDYSEAWRSGPGTDKSVKWPVGTGARGNDGVAGCVKQTQGAVGYVEQAYALQNNFTTASVENSSGRFVEPSLDATSAAGDGFRAPADLRFATINTRNPDSYPISATTFMVGWQDACRAGLSRDTATSLVAWFDYILGPGQDTNRQLQYAPVPDAIKAMAQARVDALTCNGSPIEVPRG